MKWKNVTGFPYQVSDSGIVKNIRTGRILKCILQANGYFHVTLCNKGVLRQVSVHRLVAETFLGPCPLGFQVNHIDGIKSNNALSNLEYVDFLGNMRHASKMKLTALGDKNGMRKYPGRFTGEKHPRAKLTWKQVDKIRSEYIPAYGNRGILMKRYRISAPTLQDILSGKTWKQCWKPNA